MSPSPPCYYTEPMFSVQIWMFETGNQGLISRGFVEICLEVNIIALHLILNLLRLHQIFLSVIKHAGFKKKIQVLEDQEHGLCYQQRQRWQFTGPRDSCGSVADLDPNLIVIHNSGCFLINIIYSRLQVDIICKMI